jgi:TfoX/Sxy family transcriptional regulator of competence genes
MKFYIYTLSININIIMDCPKINKNIFFGERIIYVKCGHSERHTYYKVSYTTICTNDKYNKTCNWKECAYKHTKFNKLNEPTIEKNIVIDDVILIVPMNIFVRKFIYNNKIFFKISSNNVCTNKICDVLKCQYLHTVDDLYKYMKYDEYNKQCIEIERQRNNKKRSQDFEYIDESYKKKNREQTPPIFDNRKVMISNIIDNKKDIQSDDNEFIYKCIDELETFIKEHHNDKKNQVI